MCGRPVCPRLPADRTAQRRSDVQAHEVYVIAEYFTDAGSTLSAAWIVGILLEATSSWQGLGPESPDWTAGRAHRSPSPAARRMAAAPTQRRRGGRRPGHPGHLSAPR